MKQSKFIVCFLAIVIVFSSCSSAKYWTSEVKPFEIHNVLKVEPLSYISFIEKGNRGKLNDSISQKAQMALGETLDMYRDHLCLSSDEIVISELFDYRKLENEINVLIQSAEKTNDVKKISIPPSLEFILSGNGKRFGLVVVQDGFLRSPKNYGNQVTKKFILGLLAALSTGEIDYQDPLISVSTLYAVIVDNQEKNVAFFNKSTLQDIDPTDRETFERQINLLFANYFWEIPDEMQQNDDY